MLLSTVMFFYKKKKKKKNRKFWCVLALQCYFYNRLGSLGACLNHNVIFITKREVWALV